MKEYLNGSLEKSDPSLKKKSLIRFIYVIFQ